MRTQASPDLRAESKWLIAFNFNMKRFLGEAAENLSPAYFSLVMATGIISVAGCQL
jgi:hypothetical protein